MIMKQTNPSVDMRMPDKYNTILSYKKQSHYKPIKEYIFLFSFLFSPFPPIIFFQDIHSLPSLHFLSFYFPPSRLSIFPPSFVVSYSLSFLLFVCFFVSRPCSCLLKKILLFSFSSNTPSSSLSLCHSLSFYPLSFLPPSSPLPPLPPSPPLFSSLTVMLSATNSSSL